MPAIIQLYLMELLTPDMRSVLGATLMINVRYIPRDNNKRAIIHFKTNAK